MRRLILPPLLVVVALLAGCSRESTPQVAGGAAPEVAPVPDGPLDGLTLEQWVGELKSGSNARILVASRTLGAYGPKAGDAVPALVAVIEPPEQQGNDYEVSNAVVEALARIGPAAGPALAEWVRPRLDNAGHVPPVEAAVWALGETGPAAKAIAPDLAKRVGDTEKYYGEQLKRKLDEARKAVPPPDPAAEAARLKKVLAEERRGNFYEALWKIDPATAATLVPADPPGPTVLRIALGEVVQALKGGPKTFGPGYAQAATAAGPRLAPAVPVMVALARDPATPAPFRRDVLILLGRSGAAGGPPLVEMVAKTPDPADRSALLEALSYSGPHARGATGELTKLLAGFDYSRRPLAGKEPDVRLVNAVLYALARFGPAGREAVPTVSEMLKAETLQSGEVRRNVDAVLSAMGPAARGAVPPLTDLVRTGDVPAAEVLARIGPAARPAVPAMLEGLQKSQSHDYYKIRHAVEDLDPAAGERAKTLRPGGPDRPPPVRVRQ